MDKSEIVAIAKHYGFRAIADGENETSYRRALATFLRRNGHIIEAHEVASGKRWDQDKHTALGIVGAVSKARQGKEYPVDELGTDYAAGVLATTPQENDGLGEALNALGAEGFAAIFAAMFRK